MLQFEMPFYPLLFNFLWGLFNFPFGKEVRQSDSEPRPHIRRSLTRSTTEWTEYGMHLMLGYATIDIRKNGEPGSGHSRRRLRLRRPTSFSSWPDLARGAELHWVRQQAATPPE